MKLTVRWDAGMWRLRIEATTSAEREMFKVIGQVPRLVCDFSLTNSTTTYNKDRDTMDIVLSEAPPEDPAGVR